jgi:hypothetical protein
MDTRFYPGFDARRVDKVLQANEPVTLGTRNSNLLQSESERSIFETGKMFASVSN